MGVLGFSAHPVVAAAVEEEWVRAQLPAGDLMAPLAPPFLVALGARLGRHPDSLDLVLAADGLDGSPELLAEQAARDHPRAARALVHREGVRVFGDAGGDVVATLGRGLAGRLEVSFEVAADARGGGLARRALLDLRRLAGPGEPLFGQTSPANTASVRALLAAGFAPVGAEVLFYGHRPRD